MATENTLINPGLGGDTIRDIVRPNGIAKTQVFVLDIGGPSANAELLLAAGQQLAAASIPVVLASDQPAIATIAVSANNSWAQALAVAPSATATILSILSSQAGYKVAGLVAMGNGNGYFTIQIASTTILSGVIGGTNPNLIIILPNGVSVPTGANVTLQVTNLSSSAANFEATLLGE